MDLGSASRAHDKEMTEMTPAAARGGRDVTRLRAAASALARGQVRRTTITPAAHSKECVEAADLRCPRPRAERPPLAPSDRRELAPVGPGEADREGKKRLLFSEFAAMRTSPAHTCRTRR